MKQVLDLTGYKSGKLTVVKFSRIHNRSSYWICKCECGQEREVRRDHLIKRSISSCGCYNRNSEIGKTNPHFKGVGEIPKTFWTQIKKNALKRELDFTISMEDAWSLFLKQNRACALSGKSLFFGSRKTPNNASLDRIDSSKGYSIDNVQWVDRKVNFMKQALPESEFLDLCKMILDFHRLRESKQTGVPRINAGVP